MTARTHTGARSVRATSAGVDTRLPWWALALPVLAFVALFLLITGPGQAHAAGGDPGIGGILERIQQTLPL
ncbi:hypothetical protein ACFY7C_15255 [Streptomyces sp. NPDC012769]|uniref:hypothetical protein n=1 Tax=Streptomyces sp. NPDC012769 TaxID=3364848 RepID=UPI0036BD47A9